MNAAGRHLSLRLVEEGYAVPVINTDPLRRAALDAAVSAQRAPMGADCGARSQTPSALGRSQRSRRRNSVWRPGAGNVVSVSA
ncbi:MAG: hypothetical protein H6962_08770 [Chromatiaceae bacterium]|nr:hypothetical protein [Chromatiaceae bacterium]